MAPHSSLVTGLATAVPPATRPALQDTDTGTSSRRNDPGRKHPASSPEPMPPLTFAGALLAGLGTILLLHGGALVFRHRETLHADRRPIPATWEAVVRGLGGLAITAGLALAGFVSRRKEV